MCGHKLAAEQIWVLVQARPLPGVVHRPCVVGRCTDTGCRMHVNKDRTLSFINVKGDSLLSSPAQPVENSLKTLVNAPVAYCSVVAATQTCRPMAMEISHPRDNAHDNTRNWPSKQPVQV